MSLYDDLGVAANDTKTEGWSKNFKLLQSQLKVKKAALTQAKTQRMKQTTVLAPVIDLKRGGSSDERQITDTPPHAAAGLKDPVPSGFSSGDVLIPLADEYDPMFPNDYEKVVKRHREERQRQREQERQKEIEEREKKRKDRHDGGAPSGFSRFPAAEGDSDEDEEYEKERRKRSMGGAAIAPPSSLVDRDGSIPYAYEDEGRPARGSKAAIPPPMYEDSDRPRSPPGPTSSFLANMGGTVAHKIMQKYGFKEGQGLGKHEQGLSTALSVEKTSKRGGKIIIGDAAEKRKYTLCTLLEFSSHDQCLIHCHSLFFFPIHIFRLFTLLDFVCQLHEKRPLFVSSRLMLSCDRSVDLFIRIFTFTRATWHPNAAILASVR
ncbi:hypothetical protein PAMA_013062 [Pampus argenteus]